MLTPERVGTMKHAWWILSVAYCAGVLDEKATIDFQWTSSNWQFHVGPALVGVATWFLLRRAVGKPGE